MNRIILILTAISCSAFGNQQVDFTSSNLPIVIINTNGQSIRDDVRIVADMGIIFNGEGNRNNVTDTPNNYNGRISIEIRGSSSQMFPKKQYALETQDELGNNLNVPLLGMPDENDWILYAPYSDKSLIRNVLAYKLAHDLGYYASRTRLCELVLNGDYRGVYVLMEKIKRDNDRVNISRLNPDEISGDDLTGGYIIKIDKRDGENVGGWYSPFLPYPGSNSKIYYQFHYPKPDEIVPEQESYIQYVINRFESVMYSSTYNDPVNGYGNYIDVNSFIDFYILNEISKNVDGYRLSTFLYKDKDSLDTKLYLGPIWDFNLAFGNANYYDGGTISEWQVDINSNTEFINSRDPFQIPFWWQKLMADDNFINLIHCRWAYLRENILSINRLHTYIDSLANVLDESQTRNFECWPILDTYIWPNPVWMGSYPDEISYLKYWIKNRIEWIDANLAGDCSSEVADNEDNLPLDFLVSQNYPNPFNAGTFITFNLPDPAPVYIQIFDIRGVLVRSVSQGNTLTGINTYNFDGLDQSGAALPSGFYFCQIRAGHQSQTIKMLMIK